MGGNGRWGRGGGGYGREEGGMWQEASDKLGTDNKGRGTTIPMKGFSLTYDKLLPSRNQDDTNQIDGLSQGSRRYYPFPIPEIDTPVRQESTRCP